MMCSPSSRAGNFIRLALLALLAFLPLSALAHKPSDSYLTVQVQPERVQVQWDLAIRDLDFALGLDSNDDGAVTWGEVKEQQPNISRYASDRLKLAVNDQNIALVLSDLLIDRHSDGTYVVLRFGVPFSKSARRLQVDYRAFFDLDPQHRGLCRLEAGGETRTAIFSPEQPMQIFDLQTPTAAGQWLEFIREGVWHIWIGIDHVLFLIALLLPAVLLRGKESWRGAERFSAVFINVLKVVTSFTVAHSLTLALATFGVVQLPSRLVESTIAASVVLAALHNLFPVLKGKAWLAAFGFGLVHGFGFASVLGDLGLTQRSLGGTVWIQRRG
jgi:hypothetical protein